MGVPKWIHGVLLAATLIAAPVRAELLYLGDVTRDTDSGLDWLDVNLTQDLSFNEVLLGSGGWVTSGWRHAVFSEFCGLVNSHASPMPVCPGNPPDNPSGVCEYDLSNLEFVEAFGITYENDGGYLFKRVTGQLDDGSTYIRSGYGQVQVAIGVEPPISEEPDISCTFAQPDVYGVTEPGDRAGHWLIRPNTCPDSGLLYGLSGESGVTGRLIQINTCTGVGTEVASLTPFGGDAGLAFDANRGLFYVLDGQAGGAPTLFSIQIGTWITEPLGPVDLTTLGAYHVADPGLAYDPWSDTLYLVEQNNNTLFAISVDPNGVQPLGTPTEIGPLFLSVENVGLAFDEVSGLLFAVSHGPQQDPTGTGRLIEIDPSTGAGVEVGTGIGGQLTGAAIGFDRELGYASDSFTDTLVMTFPTTGPGASSEIGPIGFGNVEGLAYVPEPDSGLMLMNGLLALLVLARVAPRSAQW